MDLHRLNLYVARVKIINLITWTFGPINQYISFKIFVKAKRENATV